MSNLEQWSPRALAALRIMTALLFLEHATMKFLAFPAPVMPGAGPLPPMMLAAGVIEVVTSVLILIGFKTRVAAFLASGEMAVAYFMAHAPQSFWPAINKGEPAILFCFIFLYLVFAGAGDWSVDRALAARSENSVA
jgi:putative oxidoreductase